MLPTICLLAVSLSIDALGIGIVYGVRNIKITIWPRIIISLFTVVITSLSLMFGKWLASGLELSPFAAKGIGAAVLGAAGLWIIYQSFNGNDGKPATTKEDTTLFSCFIASFGISIKIMRHARSADIDNSLTIEPLEAMYLGFALSIDSLGAGFGSAVSGLYSLWIPLVAAGFQMIFLSAGILAGVKLKGIIRIESRLWTLLSGIMLIVLAVIRFCL